MFTSTLKNLHRVLCFYAARRLYTNVGFWLYRQNMLAFHFIDSKHVAIPVYTRLFSVKSAAKHLASCTWGMREAHFEVKMLKHQGFGPLLEVQMSLRVAGARDCAPCQKCSTTTTTTPHYTPIHYTTLQLQLHLHYILQAIDKVAPFLKKCLYLVASKLSLEVVPFWKRQANSGDHSATMFLSVFVFFLAFSLGLGI